MPTRAERSGIMRPATATYLYPSNFPVASLRGTPIEDPSRATPDNPTGRNILPQRYITPNGAAIMRVFQVMEGQASFYLDQPLANNTTFQLANTDRRREDILRLDYALSPGTISPSVGSMTAATISSPTKRAPYPLSAPPGKTAPRTIRPLGPTPTPPTR